VVVAGLSLAGCSASSTASNSSRTPSSPVTTSNQLPSSVGPTTPTGSTCTSGTTTVTAQFGEEATPVCVKIGSTLVLTGGDSMSGGTWPGPPTISTADVLTLVSSHVVGSTLSATLKATGVGTATVEAPFVAGQNVCNPTPCTPVPGRPLIWQATVVR